MGVTPGHNVMEGAVKNGMPGMTAGCRGAWGNSSRAQLKEGLHQIAQTLRNPRRADPMGWRPFPGNWGIHGLPIEFDRAEPAIAD